MAGPRQPLEVVQAKGRKHLTKAEIAKRQAGEIKGDGDIKQLRAPEWLPESQRDEFNRVSRALIKLMPSMVSRIDGGHYRHLLRGPGWLAEGHEVGPGGPGAWRRRCGPRLGTGPGPVF